MANKDKKVEETGAVPTTPAQDTALSKLYDLETTAFSRASEAKRAYDDSLNQVGDAYTAIADMMKPKDREPEQKRIRNVAMAQALGQGLSAIFGGIYANSKKGRGKIVQPQDFASKTLAKAEELREKGLLEEQAYKRLLGDMRLRGAELTAKKAGEDYAAAKSDYDRAKAAIERFEEIQRQQQFQAAQAQQGRDFQAAQTKANQEFQAGEAEKTRQHNLQLKQIEQGQKANGVFAGVDDATISMTMGFLPKTRSEARKRTDEYGTTQYYYETVPAQSWTEEEYKSALNQARAYINGIKGKIGDANVQELAKSNSLVEIDELLKDLSQSENQKYDWNYVANLLKNGVRVDELAPFLSAKSKNNGK